MAFASLVKTLRAGEPFEFPEVAITLQYAQMLDGQDELSHLRNEFVIPSKKSLKKRALDGLFPGEEYSSTANDDSVNNQIKSPEHVAAEISTSEESDSSCIYFVGNSLGAQPRTVRSYLNAQLETWASVGVHGHFNDLENSPLVAWQDMAEDCARKSAKIIGALPSEVVIMNTLTANLHLLMASFYRPDEKRHKIILEWKPFPSDYYAIDSQIRWHGGNPAQSMIEIQPDSNSFISTERILAVIDKHAEETALLMLPGVQYYSGQLFDIPRITKYARERSIVVGWDLAHAAGNVELQLHDWNVDFAVWCTYKYLNAGPGAIAGAFVHECHGKVDYDVTESGQAPAYRPRLSGWYGGDKAFRFNMDKTFRPTLGAGGFQVSNPSAIDLASLSASLSIFGKTNMAALRNKSLVLTAYAEHLLERMLWEHSRRADGDEEPPFRIITPKDPLQRGVQLSLLLRPGLLERVGAALKNGGVVCDQRKPDVVRLAPVPMYCTFTDVWKCMEIFRAGLMKR